LDSELVSGSLSATEGSGQSSSLPLLTYTDKFYELFPYYLSIGMTSEQYWDSDCTLVKYYRKAEEMRNEKRNQELWLQGMYVYEAICDVAPILHAFAKKGTKPTPYTAKPYPLNAKQIKRDEEEKRRKLAEKGKKFMEAMAASVNKKFEGKTQSQE
jgi:hypothetical protein